jgi:hypothetical protein
MVFKKTPLRNAFWQSLQIAKMEAKQIYSGVSALM